jgi:hypothetical protein
MLNKHLSSLASFAAGGGFCLALVLSCGDQSPSDADASCDCAPAEAPLAGRTEEVEIAITLPPANMSPVFGKRGTGIDCPQGGVLLSGGCAASLGAVPDIVVEATYPILNSWRCDWKNLSNDPVPVRAIARCLMPAQ